MRTQMPSRHSTLTTTILILLPARALRLRSERAHGQAARTDLRGTLLLAGREPRDFPVSARGEQSCTSRPRPHRRPPAAAPHKHRGEKPAEKHQTAANSNSNPCAGPGEPAQPRCGGWRLKTYTVTDTTPLGPQEEHGASEGFDVDGYGRLCRETLGETHCEARQGDE